MRVNDHSVALSVHSDENERRVLTRLVGQGRHGRLTLQTKDISETDGKRVQC